MKNRRELDIQREICQSVRKDGGWARKLTNRFTIGIPDLLVALYPFVPCLLEVKDLGEVGEMFHRKLNVTEKQRHELIAFDEAISEAHGRDTHQSTGKRYASAVLVGWSWGRDRWLAMLPPDETYASNYTKINAVIRKPGGYYPIGPLFELFDRMHRVKLI